MKLLLKLDTVPVWIFGSHQNLILILQRQHKLLLNTAKEIILHTIQLCFSQITRKKNCRQYLMLITIDLHKIPPH
jgi:hypothetical protein